MTSHPNWVRAQSALSKIIGENSGFDIDELDGIDSTTWKSCALNADSDHERWSQLCEVVGFSPSGNLIIVDDSSLAGYGPFFTHVDELADFFEDHVAEVHDCVLTSGDLFVIAVDENRVILYHHSELALVMPVQ